MRKALIIGAGPAGLTAAYELLTNRQPGSPAVDNSYEVIVFEETEAMGGISKTVNHNGNRMDMADIVSSQKFRKSTNGGRKCCLNKAPLLTTISYCAEKCRFLKGDRTPKRKIGLC